MHKLFQLGLLSGSLLLGGCLGDQRTEAERSGTDNDDQIKALIQDHQLNGDPAASRTIPAIDDALAQLGMQLFFSKALSGEMDVACATCHHPKLGGSDGLSLPIGVEAVNPDLLGPGREHSSSGTDYDAGPTVPRNSPTTFNVALWDQVLFHDGRVASLASTPTDNGEGTSIQTPDSTGSNIADPNAGDNLTAAQARFPVTSPEEMMGHSKGMSRAEIRAYLVERLKNENNDLAAKNEWLEAFRVGFNAPNDSRDQLITEENIFKAIAAYERSQTFTDSPWKDYVGGDESALTSDAKKGALLFFRTIEAGGANCASCHSGDKFSDEQFHNIAMIQIGRGKGDGTSADNDFGRFKVTADDSDMFKFRTPSLLNVEFTAPYGHSGAYDKLEDVIRHHLSPTVALNDYQTQDFAAQAGLQDDNLVANTQLALDALQSDRDAGISGVLTNVELSDEEVGHLVAFLRALSDRCLSGEASESCDINDWIPDESTADPDGLRLMAQFQD